MDKTNLPPLPEPAVRFHRPESLTTHARTEYSYTAEQMHEYAARAVREAGAGIRLVGSVDHGKVGEINWYEDVYELEDGGDVYISVPAAPTQDQENGS